MRSITKQNPACGCHKKGKAKRNEHALHLIERSDSSLPRQYRPTDDCDGIAGSRASGLLDGVHFIIQSPGCYFGKNCLINFPATLSQPENAALMLPRFVATITAQFRSGAIQRTT